VNTCACYGYRLLFCTHPRTCRFCGALTTGLRPAELNACGGCAVKVTRVVFSDEEPLVPHLREQDHQREEEAAMAALS
jgi:hypothetical protein